MTLGAAFEFVLSAAKANEGWAFRRLFEDLARPVAAYLRVQGARDPDDLVNETFLGAFSGIASFTGDEAGFRSWVFTIAHRRLVDERRRMARRPDTSGTYDDHPAPGGDAEEQALQSLGDERVRVLLDGLVTAQRHVLLLRIVGDLTVEQVAGVLGKRAGAVKALQRRGLLALKKEIFT
nr:sigma-70 family RNA polymerase sigma factor [Actinomycetota bacterium]